MQIPFDQWGPATIAALGTVTTALGGFLIKDRLGRAKSAVDLEKVLNERIDKLLKADEEARDAMRLEIVELRQRVSTLEDQLRAADQDKRIAETLAATANQQLALANAELMQVKDKLHACEEARRLEAEKGYHP